MKIVVPLNTPSVNHLYGRRGFRSYLKPEAKELRKEIIEIVQQTAADPIFLPQRPLEIHIKIYENWYNKDGTIKRKDIGNKEKFLVDSIFEGLNADDKVIFKHTMEKIQSDEEKFEVELIEYGKR